MTFETIENEIKPILERFTEARADDMALYCLYVAGRGADIKRTLLEREYRLKRGIASYESVGRIRRKLQHANEDLRPTAEYLIERQRAEKEFIAYAKRQKK